MKKREHYNGDSDNYYRLDQQSEVGSTLEGKDGVNLVVKNDVRIRQSDISSENGKVLIGTRQGDIKVEAGREDEQLATASKSVRKGRFGLSKTTETTRYEHHIDQAVGSNIDGQLVSLIAGQGNVSVKGSNVVAENELAIAAKQNVEIVSDINTRYQDEQKTKKKSGLMGSGGIGFTIGTKKEKIDQDRTEQSATRSQVGSLNGNVLIQAGQDYLQKGSVVSSGKGDVDISAKKVNIEAARSDYESNYRYELQQKGVTIALTGAVAAAIQAVDSATKSTKAIGSSQNNRVNALGALNAGFEVIRAAESVQALGQAMADSGIAQGASSGVGISITYGQQKTVQTQHSEGNRIEKSAVNSRGKLNIRAAGAGDQSALDIVGSDVLGQQGTHLKSEGSLNIAAADENHLERSKNKSSGFNVGAAIQFGNGISVGITAGGNVAKGYGNGDSQAWIESRVGSRDSTTTLESGKDTHILGSQVKGKRVEVNAENLIIESQQDTARYEGKQEKVSGQVTVGWGFSAEGSYNKSKVKSNYASVKNQAGIFAGDEGYGVNVKNNIQLKAGAIVSTSEKEKNQLNAQDFSYSDLQNYATAKSSAMGLMGGFSVNRDQTSQEDKELNEIYRKGREGETFEQANPNKVNQRPVQFGLGGNDVHSADLYAIAKLGLANLASNSSRKEHRESTTESVISDGIFNIGSEQGKQAITEIKKSTSEATNKLDNIDYSQIQKEVEQDVETIQSFAKNVAGLTDEAYRTMFLAEHRMFTHKVDGSGNPIEDPSILNRIYSEADEKGVARKHYLKEQLDKGRNIYQLHELSDQERTQLQKVAYTDPITGKTESKYVVAFNGIFNDRNSAAKFAVQNYVAGKDEKLGDINKQLHGGVYFVHHPKANNGVSELFVAGYEKMLEGSFGNALGMDNSALQAMDLMKGYGKDDLYFGSHSRGTLTISNALNALNTKENQEKRLLSGTTIKMVGPAADVTRADNRLSLLQTGNIRDESNASGSIRIENNALDPVGSMPILLGGNPATTSENNLNNSWLKVKAHMFSDKHSSVHNCHGLGQGQCVTDGYRSEADLKMGNERTIFDLNKTSK
ncbi:hemagglutinin repeat-containing protein [Rodentibacter caecimuris]|uniref:hemagglutinin repeat-containing protein n=1 Tax=Rodentibacter caecimuris TaxID=1796644 RepID=UPI00098411FA|nr:hypothetical protein BKG97_10190 [Rodentibacter heylii]